MIGFAEHPESVGRFKVIGVLGRGGMGYVYKAHDPMLQRLVAVKVLLADGPGDTKRLLREARLAGRLSHRNIVKVYDVEGGVAPPFIVMEYIDGETLADKLKSPEATDLERRLKWMIDLCGGLAEAHASNIFHLDIKPSNLMVDTQDILKILDFGIARREGDTETSTHVAGTPGYIAPERLNRRPADSRSDLFSVGAVLYELLAKTKAFPGNYEEAQERACNGAPVPILEIVPTLPQSLAAIVARALEPDPAKRFSSADEMSRALTDAVRSVTPEALLHHKAKQLGALLEASRKAFQDGKLEQALDTARKALALAPDDTQALETLAHVTARSECRKKVEASRERLKLGDGDGARLAAIEALVFVPDDPDARTALEQAESAVIMKSASQHFDSGRREEALRVLRVFVPFWRVRDFHNELMLKAAAVVHQEIERALGAAQTALDQGDLPQGRIELEAAALAGAPSARVQLVIESMGESELFQSIRVFLTTYERRLAARDVTTIRPLWPTIPDAALERLNRDPTAIVQFKIEDIKTNGDGSVVVLAKEHVSGSSLTRRVRLMLEKNAQSWRITHIERLS